MKDRIGRTSFSLTGALERNNENGKESVYRNNTKHNSQGCRKTKFNINLVCVPLETTWVQEIPGCKSEE